MRAAHHVQQAHARGSKAHARGHIMFMFSQASPAGLNYTNLSPSLIAPCLLSPSLPSPITCSPTPFPLDPLVRKVNEYCPLGGSKATLPPTAYTSIAGSSAAGVMEGGRRAARSVSSPPGREMTSAPCTRAHMHACMQVVGCRVGAKSLTCVRT